jgi:hypothetical protein
MNHFDPLPGGREAKLKFYSGDYDFIQRGDFVRCAVTKAPILIEELRYWDFEKQEAYATAQAMLQRHQNTHGDAK